MQTTAESREFETGYLAGLVDGEGCIFVSHRKPNDRTYPRLRIFSTSKPIVDGAGRIMGVNPYPRRDHGKLVGWYVSAEGGKTVEVVHNIASHLTDPSKRCRAFTILKVFDTVVSIQGRHPSAEVFAHCPPPVRLRAQEVPNSSGSLDSQGAREDTEEISKMFTQQLVGVSSSPEISEIPALDLGWLCGMVDGEGYIHVRYRSDRDSTYPRLRLFVKTRTIIDAVARLMGVNPYARRSRGKVSGWYASVSHRQALRALRLIGPHLLDPSKKCRAQKILEAFGEVGTIHSRLDTFGFFNDCPPPSRIRKSGRVISGA